VTDLDARYGRRSPSTRRIAIWATAIGLVVAALVWFVWAQPIDTSPQATWRDTGYVIVDPSREIVAEWEVTVEPGHPVQCALYAMNSAFAVIGWKVVDLPASDQRIRQFRDSILTTEPPVTGLVYRCWVA